MKAKQMQVRLAGAVQAMLLCRSLASAIAEAWRAA
jgi:hypothetical protein